MRRLAEAVADGCAQALGRRQGAEDDSATVGIECAQAGVEVGRQFFGIGPVPPGEDDGSRWSRAGEFCGQHQAESFARTGGNGFGEPVWQISQRSFEQYELRAGSVVAQADAGGRQCLA